MKRKLSAMLGLLLLCGILCLSAEAAGTEAVLGTVSGNAGDTLQVSAELQGNPGLAGWCFVVEWDASVMELVDNGVWAGEAFSSGTLMSNPQEGGKLTVIWYDVKDSNADGTLFTLNFRASDGAAAGVYPITLICSAQDTINVEEEQVPVTVISGSVSLGGTTGSNDSADTTSSSLSRNRDNTLDSGAESLSDSSGAPAEENTEESSGPAGDTVEAGNALLNEAISETETVDSSLFSDVPRGHWAYDYIEHLVACGVVSGVGNHYFDPQGQVTRAQFVKMIACAVGADTTGRKTARFSDVSADAWYAPYIAWALDFEIVKGTSETEFSPDASITREQMAVIILRCAEKMNIQLPKAETGVVFWDEEEISLYAINAVIQMQDAGLISGYPDGSFCPQGTASRAEAAKVISIFIKTYL